MARWTDEEKASIDFQKFSKLESCGTHSFEESIKNGTIGELYAKTFLENQYMNHPDNVAVEIKDVTRITDYQFKGIDLLIDIKKRTGQTHRVLMEVKNDSYTTNNLFVEMASNAETGTKGCVFTSMAHWWIYIYENQDRAIMFKPQELVKFMNETKKDYRQVMLTNTGSETQEGYNTYGVLVPVEDIVNKIPSAKEIRMPIRAMAEAMGIAMSRFKEFKAYRSCIDGQMVRKPYDLMVHPTEKQQELVH